MPFSPTELIFERHLALIHSAGFVAVQLVGVGATAHLVARQL